MGIKLTFSGQARKLANDMARLDHDLEALNSVYFDRGYNSGGSDPIIDADIAELNVTAADIAGMVTIAQQFRNFLNNVAVVTGDYDTTLSQLRSDF